MAGPLEIRPKSGRAGQNWEKRPKAPDARQTNAEAKERMRNYVTEPRRRITQQTGLSAASIGLIHVYTGDGKGKTTAAIGLAVRAAGRGWRCRIIQFMKGATTSGETSAQAAIPNIEIDRIGLNMVGPAPSGVDEVKTSLLPAMTAARAAIVGQFDLVVLDEIITACSAGVLAESDILSLIDEKHKAVELVLTGRGASEALIARADYVTEMVNIKHPFDSGRQARIGIEF